MNFLSWSIIVLLSITDSFQESDKILNLEVYYESLCPYSQAFFINQVLPTYQALGDLVYYDLVPFGKSKQSVSKKGTISFTCQHGPKECKGNKIQACVLEQEFNQKRKIGFVTCVMHLESYTDRDVKKCAKNNEIKWKTIKDCVKTKGDEILSGLGNRTAGLDPPLKFVPHIRFNGLPNETLETEARNDLKKVVCGLIIPKPDACNE